MIIITLFILLIGSVNAAFLTSTTPIQTITADSLSTYEWFGSALAMTDTWLVIGEYKDNSNVGSIHIYKNEGGTWTYKTKITNANNDNDSSYQYAYIGQVVISGETIAVSDIREDMPTNANADAGTVWVYKRSTDTSWPLEQEINSPDNGAHVGGFGQWLALEGDHLIIGDYQDDPSGNTNAGTVWYYDRTGTTWTQRQEILPDGATAASQDNWGYTVTLLGDSELFIQMRNKNGGTYTNEGRVYHFTRSGTTWTQQQVIAPPSVDVTANNMYFGDEICADGNVMCVTTSTKNAYCYGRADGSSSYTLKSTLDYASNSDGSQKSSRACFITGGYLVFGNKHGIESGGESASGQAVIYSQNGDQTFTFDSTVAPHSAFNSAYCGWDIAHGNFNMIVSCVGYATSGNFGAGELKVYQMSTPAPTVSPTASPTQSCTTFADCTDADDYCHSGGYCATEACVDHIDCDSFKDGRLPYCHSGGYCRDDYEGECSTTLTCDSAVNTKLADDLALVKVTRTINANTGVLRQNVTIEMLADLNTELTLSNQTYITVKNTESALFDQSILDQVNASTLKDGIKTKMCGDYADLCTVTIGSRRLLSDTERDLQSSGSITVEIVYDVDETAYNEIGGDSFDNAAFEQQLADQLGIGVGNITVSGVNGDIVISITIVEEVDGDPIGDEIIDEINQIDSELDTITTNLVASTPGLDATDISAPDVDLCVDRDCNGRGTCDPATGECECTGNWWGINCETECVCDNGRTCVNAVCQCEYPEYGLRCENTKDCSC